MATFAEKRRARAERARRYLARVEAGETYDQIGASEGISGKGVLYYIRKEYGGLAAAQPRWRAELVQAVDRLWFSTDQCQREIAKQLGVSLRAVEAICRTAAQRNL